MDGSSCQEPGTDLVDEEGCLAGSNGQSMIICESLLFLFKHLSFLKQSLHSSESSTEVCVRMSCFVPAHVLRRKKSPSLTLFRIRIIRRNRWLPSKINLITLSYALRPIAKLCLSARPDRNFFLYSQCVLLGGTRGRRQFTGVRSFTNVRVTRRSINQPYLACLRHILLRNRPTQTEYLVQLSQDIDRLYYAISVCRIKNGNQKTTCPRQYSKRKFVIEVKITNYIAL